MNTLEFKSLNENVKSFCEKLNDLELVDLTDFLNYSCYTDKPNKLAIEFITEFFGTKDWENNLSDEIKKPEFSNKATFNTKEIIKLVRVGLLQECFFRFVNHLKGIPYVPKLSTPKLSIPKDNGLSNQDKKILKAILNEHHAMLDYQLEDEDGVINAGGKKLVNEKKQHRDFIEKFKKMKICL